MAFFSGYPLVYTLIRAAIPVRPNKIKPWSRLFILSPYAYAVLGTLYLGLQIKQLYPDYSVDRVATAIRENYLKIWGILAVFFWLPPLSKKPVLSLCHSLVILALLVYDLLMRLAGRSTDTDRVRNDMNIYTLSLMLSVVVYLLVAIIAFIYYRAKADRYDKPHTLR